MSFEELQKLLNYIQENNSWEKMTENNLIQKRHRRNVKYVQFTVDTRDAKVWHVKFYGLTDINKKSVEFRIENQSDLNKVYEWLDKPTQ